MCVRIFSHVGKQSYEIFQLANIQHEPRQGQREQASARERKNCVWEFALTVLLIDVGVRLLLLLLTAYTLVSLYVCLCVILFFLSLVLFYFARGWLRCGFCYAKWHRNFISQLATLTHYKLLNSASVAAANIIRTQCTVCKIDECVFVCIL